MQFRSEIIQFQLNTHVSISVLHMSSLMSALNCIFPLTWLVELSHLVSEVTQ